MAATNKREAGQAILDVFMGKLPADLQTKAREVLAGDAVSDALDTLGDAALRQQDYSRGMDEVKTRKAEVEAWHGTLTDWHKNVKDTVAIGEAAKKAGWKPGDPLPVGDPTNTPPAGVSREDVDKILTEREGNYAAFAGQLNTLVLSHFQNFGEVLDTVALMKDPQVKDIGLMGVYQERFKDKYAEKAKKADDERIEKEVSRRMVERQAQGHNPRFPGVARDPGSPLDALDTTQKPNPGDFSAEAAADEYSQLVAGKTA